MMFSKVILYVCGIITAYVLLVMLAMFTKSAYDYFTISLC